MLPMVEPTVVQEARMLAENPVNPVVGKDVFLN